jgi:hypothetical protein
LAKLNRGSQGIVDRLLRPRAKNDSIEPLRADARAADNPGWQRAVSRRRPALLPSVCPKSPQIARKPPECREKIVAASRRLGKLSSKVATLPAGLRASFPRPPAGNPSGSAGAVRALTEQIQPRNSIGSATLISGPDPSNSRSGDVLADAVSRREFPGMNSTHSSPHTNSGRSPVGKRSSVVRSIALAFVCGLLFAAPAVAQNIQLSLNLLYDQPATPMTSGGNWQLVAKSTSPGTFGIFGLDVFLQNISAPMLGAVGPRGIVNGNDLAGFSELDVFHPLSDVYELVIGQTPVSLHPGEEQSVFYGVGTLANGQPGQIGPTFNSLTNTAAIPWGTGDVLGESAWNAAALLANGTFLPGSTPTFAQGGFVSTGVALTSLGTSTTVGTRSMPESVSTIVRVLMFGTGDYNHDHVVNAADYTVWRNSLGQVGSGLPADGNLNGIIDDSDYDVWKMNFGTVTPGAGGGSLANQGVFATGAAVPEPSTAMLLLAALVLSILRPKETIFRNAYLSSKNRRSGEKLLDTPETQEHNARRTIAQCCAVRSRLSDCLGRD